MSYNKVLKGTVATVFAQEESPTMTMLLLMVPMLGKFDKVLNSVHILCSHLMLTFLNP